MNKLSNLRNEVFTIISQIPQSATIATKIAWKKYKLKNCGKFNGIYDRSSGTMVYKSNTFTAYINDWKYYMPPNWISGGYYALSDRDKGNYFTINIGDLIVFADIPDDEPTTLQEFNALVTKYKDNGGTITSVQAYINYTADGVPWRTNHIEAVKG